MSAAATCPECEHLLIRHADSAATFSPASPCSECRRLSNPLNTGKPLTPDECCSLTSGAVRQALDTAAP